MGMRVRGDSVGVVVLDIRIWKYGIDEMDGHSADRVRRHRHTELHL